jgi:sulfite reductase (NADPH) flavoprotein alpha-component
VADLLKRSAGSWSATDLVAALRPLTPRLYSIASSRRAVGDELHLTVADVDYLFDGERRYGAASRFLSSLDASGEAVASVRAYIEPNTRFRLPADADRNIIMIGPGTGVAPFRAFVQDRADSGARGQNWLFFGGRRLSSDFLYQTEWLDARKRGSLHRLDVAFSRDQAHKIYVQDRLRQQAADVYRWLQDGAYLYVCGDAERMAPDVQNALLDIIGAQGALQRDAAEAYLADLAAQRRYVRDVY